MKEITFEIDEEIAVLSENDNGFTKELNFVSWNGREPKLEIREWFPYHEKPGKGVTLTDEEAEALYEALQEIYEDGD